MLHETGHHFKLVIGNYRLEWYFTEGAGQSAIVGPLY